MVLFFLGLWLGVSGVLHELTIRHVMIAFGGFLLTVATRHDQRSITYSGFLVEF